MSGEQVCLPFPSGHPPPRLGATDNHQVRPKDWIEKRKNGQQESDQHFLKFRLRFLRIHAPSLSPLPLAKSVVNLLSMWPMVKRDTHVCVSGCVGQIWDGSWLLRRPVPALCCRLSKLQIPRLTQNKLWRHRNAERNRIFPLNFVRFQYPVWVYCQDHTIHVWNILLQRANLWIFPTPAPRSKMYSLIKFRSHPLNIYKSPYSEWPFIFQSGNMYGGVEGVDWGLRK